MAPDDEPVTDQTTPSQTNGTSTALLRRRATRRAVLAGGVAAAGVAGAYAAMGDRLKLFGEDGPELEAVRSDTSAINKESVKINHLLRRAGFGVTQEEYDHYQQIGLKTTIEELLAYNAIDDSEAEKAAAIANDTSNGQRIVPVSGWLARMATTKRPLQEKMTLFWHGLLTSQLSVVRDPGAMLTQVDFYRKHALDRFPDILKGVSRDPAMMIYLNIDNSARAAPNENYARELMELFSLGVGNFSEKDVREAARAFTGWQIPRERGPNPGQFDLKEPVLRPQRFDNGQKTFFGKTGNFGPDDIVDIIVEQPASAKYIVKRLFGFFVYPDPSDADLKPFIDAYMGNGKSIRSVVEAMLKSDVFYSPKAYRAIVKSPVEFAVGAIKAVNGQAARGGADGGRRATTARWRRRRHGPGAVRAAERCRLAGQRVLAQRFDHVRAAQLRQRDHGRRAAAAGPAASATERAGQRGTGLDHRGAQRLRDRHDGPGAGALPAAGPGRQRVARDAPGAARLRRRA